MEEKYSACVLLLTPFWLVVTLDDIGAALFPALMDTLVVHVYEETQELLHVVFDKLCVCVCVVGEGGWGCCHFFR